MRLICLRSAILIGLALVTVGCDQLGIGGPPDDATVEARMETGCGSGNRTSSGILDLAIGMSAAQARQILDCYDSSAIVAMGVIGTYELDIHRFLKEIEPAGAGYSNFLVWTRGEARECSNRGPGGSTQLDGNLQPDDERFAPLVFSGTQFPWFNQCLLRVKDQIVLRFGGPPDALAVVGIWRLSVPRDGRRPRLVELAAQFNARYPDIAIDQSRIRDAQFAAASVADNQGQPLDAGQIDRDYGALRPPVPPQPPVTTESCGPFGWGRCTRIVPQAETDAHQSRMREFEEAGRDYRQRQDALAALRRCTSNLPTAVGVTPLDSADPAPCGTAVAVQARPYPGGFSEIYFVGVYDHNSARQARVRLEEFVRSRRGQRAPATGNTLPPV